MKICWVRHGETEQNEKGCYYGKLDPSLTPNGIRQIKAIEKDFTLFKTIYTSPAKRAVETTKLLAKEHCFIADKRLLERDMGIFEGMTYQLIEQKYPLEQLAWQQDWKGYIIPEGESAVMQYERVKDFVRCLEIKNEDALVISHAGTIRMALCYMLGETLDLFWRFKVDNGVSITCLYEDGYWYVDFK